MSLYTAKRTKKTCNLFFNIAGNQSELNCYVTCFTTHKNKPCNLICCRTGWNVVGKSRNIVRFRVLTCLATNKVARFVFVGGKTRNIAIQLVFQQCQPRPQGFSLKNGWNGWVAPPIFRGKSPGDEGAAMLQKGLHVFCCVFYLYSGGCRP